MAPLKPLRVGLWLLNLLVIVWFLPEMALAEDRGTEPGFYRQLNDAETEWDAMLKFVKANSK